MVVFGGKMVMCVSLLDEIFCQIPLGQQSIGSDGFSLNIYAIEEWDDGFDFVGLFFFIAPFFAQGADFFWV